MRNGKGLLSCAKLIIKVPSLFTMYKHPQISRRQCRLDSTLRQKRAIANSRKGVGAATHVDVKWLVSGLAVPLVVIRSRPVLQKIETNRFGGIFPTYLRNEKIVAYFMSLF